MASAGSTGVLVGHEGKVIGGIAIADQLKEDVHESIRRN